MLICTAHGWNEELGRHRGREGMPIVWLCMSQKVSVMCCGSVLPILSFEASSCSWLSYRGKNLDVLSL